MTIDNIVSLVIKVNFVIFLLPDKDLEHRPQRLRATNRDNIIKAPGEYPCIQEVS